jgi:hypothetical protein
MGGAGGAAGASGAATETADSSVALVFTFFATLGIKFNGLVTVAPNCRALRGESAAHWTGCVWKSSK